MEVCSRLLSRSCLWRTLDRGVVVSAALVAPCPVRRHPCARSLGFLRRRTDWVAHRGCHWRRSSPNIVFCRHRVMETSQAALSSVVPVFSVMKFDTEGNVTSFEKKKTELYQDLGLQARDLRFQHTTSITGRNNLVIMRMESLKAVVTPHVLLILDFRGLGLERWLLYELGPQLAGDGPLATYSLPFEFRVIEAILQHRTPKVLYKINGEPLQPQSLFITHLDDDGSHSEPVHSPHSSQESGARLRVSSKGEHHFYSVMSPHWGTGIHTDHRMGFPAAHTNTSSSSNPAFLLNNLQTRLNEVQPLILDTLESLVDPKLLSADRSQLHVLLQNSKSLSELETDIKVFKECLLKILDEDELIEELCLTKWTDPQVFEESSQGIDHADEMELLLENYYMQAEDLGNKTRELKGLIDDCESVIFINLDSHRNVMMRLNLQLTMGTFSLSLFGLIGVAFGMNLESSFEEDPRVFWLVTGFMFLGSGLIWRRLLSFLGRHLVPPSPPTIPPVWKRGQVNSLRGAESRVGVK